MVASFAKENHLATLVAQETAGEVLGGANFKLPGGYVLRMPVAGWYTWNGECIEGKGVEPDVPIENLPESLAMGVDASYRRPSRCSNTLKVFSYSWSRPNRIANDRQRNQRFASTEPMARDNFSHVASRQWLCLHPRVLQQWS